MSGIAAPWSDIWRVALTSTATYGVVLVALRLAGRRTISQMSAFDVVVTIAIGSLMAPTILTPDVDLVLGLTAILSLLVAQQGVAVLRQRSPAARRLIDFDPEVVYEDRGFRLRTDPLAAQVTEAELKSKLRQKGFASTEGIRVIILEPDGSVSVMPVEDDGILDA